MPVGVLTKEVKFLYHKKGPLQGKVRERLELTGDLRVGAARRTRSGRGARRRKTTLSVDGF